MAARSAAKRATALGAPAPSRLFASVSVAIIMLSLVGTRAE
jgi:hypothetical protein